MCAFLTAHVSRVRETVVWRCSAQPCCLAEESNGKSDVCAYDLRVCCGGAEGRCRCESKSRGGCGESWGASLVESIYVVGSGIEVVVGVVVGVVVVAGSGGGGGVVVGGAIVGWWGCETGCGY